MAKPKREVAIINTRLYPSTNKLLKEVLMPARGQNIPRIIDELVRAEAARLLNETKNKLG